LSPPSPEPEGGLLLDGVQADSPAEKGGLRAGDLIVEWGGARIDSLEDIQVIFENAEAGKEVKVTVLRQGKRVELKVTPEKIG
jgi:serine protease Do